MIELAASFLLSTISKKKKKKRVKHEWMIKIDRGTFLRLFSHIDIRFMSFGFLYKNKINAF